MNDGEVAAALVTCAPMNAATRPGAFALLSEFLREDGHYLASSGAYGDGGGDALARALELFLLRPEIGFVWLASAEVGALRATVGACVVCYAISTSRGPKLVSYGLRRRMSAEHGPRSALAWSATRSRPPAARSSPSSTT